MKSFILSFLLSLLIAVYFMSLFEPKANAYYRSLPDWFFIAMAVVIFLAYALAFYWGIRGIFKEQRLLNLLGIGFSLFGIALYVLGFVMSSGNGKESAGQFDHDLGKIEMNQKKALDNLLQQTNTSPDSIQMLAYWKMYKNTSRFAICVQQGNIIGLQIKDKPVTDLSSISILKKLNWLVLENCGLKSIEGLYLPALQRCSVNGNQLASLKGIENSPDISWLNFLNNPVTDSAALQLLHNKDLYIENQP